MNTEERFLHYKKLFNISDENIEKFRDFFFENQKEYVMTEDACISKANLIPSNVDMRPGFPPELPMDDQLTLFSRIVSSLNLLAINLPVEIIMLPKDKGFAEEYLKEKKGN